MTNKLCPCGSSNNWKACCQPIIEGKKVAETAQQLMRSRYSAFTIANGSYLVKSHHPDTRNPKEVRAIENFAKSVNWIKLEVLNFAKDQKEDDFGTVEFKAYYFERGQVQVIHENSTFKRVNGIWHYYGMK